MATNDAPPVSSNGPGSSTPPRRTFGAQPTNAARLSIASLDGASSTATGLRRGSIVSAVGSPPAHTTAGQQGTLGGLTPSNSLTHLAVPSAGASPKRPSPNRQRSLSTVSTGSAAALAAERAQQWLSAFAPRGEGRGREFLSNTLSGVATVASTVGQEALNGFMNSGRTNSFTAGAGSRPTSLIATSPPPQDAYSQGPLGRRDSARSPSPTQANGANSAKRIPQPANMSRLNTGSQGSAIVVSPVGSPSSSEFHRASQSASSLNAIASLPATGGGGASHSTSGRASAPAASTRASSRQHSHVRTGSLSNEVNAATSRVRQAGMPYKIGFQPSGVRSDRSNDFFRDRQTLQQDRDKEEGRLGRRWAKLVDLHFNPATQVLPGQQPDSPSTSTSSKTSKKSFLANVGLAELDPKEVWRGLKNAAGPGADEARKRAAEQSIVKWEDDAEARRCRICQASFTLSNRKHHCRLCGRIVCSLPPTPPALLAVQMELFEPADPDAAANGASATSQAVLPPGCRREKCSLLLVADYKTGRGEEVEEGFVGWMTVTADGHEDDSSRSRKSGGTSPIRNSRRAPRQAAHSRTDSVVSTNTDGSRSTTPLPQQSSEVQVKGVRVCRECWHTVSRKQKIADRSRVTLFTRLYHALRELQTEIEGTLSEFEDELATYKGSLTSATTSAVSATSVDNPESQDVPAALLDAHRSLLTLLGQYDAIAKRIAALPCADGGSQSIVQAALARSAATFLAKSMSSVQEVPRLQRAAAAARVKNFVVVETKMEDVLRAEGVREDKAEDVARALQPLLEQQAQLESFISEANSQRKYDDAKSLGMALAEIDNEIARLSASALN